MRVASFLLQPSDQNFSDMMKTSMTSGEFRRAAPDLQKLQRALNVEINLMWNPGQPGANQCVTQVVSDYDPCRALAAFVFAPSDPGRDKFAFSSVLADPIVLLSSPVPPSPQDHLERRRALIAHGEKQARKNKCGIVAYVVPGWEFPSMAKLLGREDAENVAAVEPMPGVRAMLFNGNRVRAFFPKSFVAPSHSHASRGYEGPSAPEPAEIKDILPRRYALGQPETA